jgi:glyoxylase-like metal-dependent hydrolase (beta-lactamase superfamily II)
MKITTVGKRGVVFTFDDLSSEEYDSPTNIYVIDGNKHIFICDTFLGPESMKGVQDYIDDHFSEKQIIIFNSHYHWDHHWGNCFFEKSDIIGNELTQEMIINKGKETLKTNKKFHRGKITLTPPNILFQNKLSFLQDDVIFFFSPGHTPDSSSCFDLQDKILFAADNLEEPIPYLPKSHNDLLTYINTLYQYQKLKPEIIIPGHGSISVFGIDREC